MSSLISKAMPSKLSMNRGQARDVTLVHIRLLMIPYLSLAEVFTKQIVCLFFVFLCIVMSESVYLENKNQ